MNNEQDKKSEWFPHQNRASLVHDQKHISLWEKSQVAFLATSCYTKTILVRSS